MALNAGQKKFRSDRAQDLKILADLVEKVGIQGYQLRDIAKELTNFERTRKIDQKDEVDYSYWGYNIEAFEIPFYEPPKHVRPSKIYPLSAYLSVNMIASSDSWGNLSDPFKMLEVNIEIRGVGENDRKHVICYHIDRHLDSVSDEPHPMYHFHLGGKRMDFDNVDIGDTIFLDTPRIMFYPIDLILSFDFVLSNFFPAYWNQLQNESTYNTLIKEYYDTLVKPFAHTLASKWTSYDPASIEWHPDLLFPQLITV